MLCRKCNAEIPDISTFCNLCGTKQIADPKRRRQRSGNGCGSAFREGKGWAYRYTVSWDESGKQQRRYRSGFPTKKAALEAMVSDRATPQRDQTTLQSLWDGWSTSAMPKLSGSKQTAYRIAWEKLSAIAPRPINSLTIEDLQDCVSAKASTFYPARDMRVVLSHLYDRAVAQQWATVNLAKYVEIPPLEEKTQETFTKDEISRIWKAYAAGDSLLGYVLLMIYSGMMPGELLDCRKDMIDWERCVIIGAGKKTKVRKETPLILADAIMPVLEHLCDFSTGDKLLTMNKDNFYSAYHASLKAAGVRDLPPYSCRHTTATGLALSEIPIATIREIMRHSRITTTQRYIHLNTTIGRAAVNRTVAAESQAQK